MEVENNSERSQLLQSVTQQRYKSRWVEEQVAEVRLCAGQADDELGGGVRRVLPGAAEEGRG